MATRSAAGAAWIGVGLLSLALAERAPAPLVAADDARLLLPGLIVEESDLPVEAGGRAVVDGIPGARARRPLDATLEQRLEALDAERQRIGARSAAGAAADRPPSLPAETGAPPRLDAGDPDPERLLSLPPPRTSR
jgi:hypothetical protein